MNGISTCRNICSFSNNSVVWCWEIYLGVLITYLVTSVNGGNICSFSNTCSLLKSQRVFFGNLAFVYHNNSTRREICGIFQIVGKINAQMSEFGETREVWLANWNNSLPGVVSRSNFSQSADQQLGRFSTVVWEFSSSYPSQFNDIGSMQRCNVWSNGQL